MRIILVATVFCCLLGNTIAQVSERVTSTTSSAKITVDVDQTSSKPPATIKRGWVFPFEVNDEATLAKIRSADSTNMQLINGIRNINGWLSDGQYIDFTLQPENWCGSPLPEFYKEEGQVYSRVDIDMVNLLKTVTDSGMMAICQISGVPNNVGGTSPIPLEDIFTLDPDATWKGSGNFYPVTASDEYALHGKVVSDWMEKVENQVGAEIIWIGTQEPSHTIDAEASTEENISKYVEFWAELAKNLKSKGMKVGGIQLNAANAVANPGTGLYALTANEMKSRNSPCDYFTIQNFRGEENEEVLNDLRASLSDPYFANTKVLFNRYGYRKDLSNAVRYNSAEGVIYGLQAENIALDNADILFGYCFMNEDDDMMINKIYSELNEWPIERKDVEIEVANSTLGSFACANSSEFSMVIWNTGSTTDITIKINGTISYDGTSLVVRKGSGSSYTTTSANWDASTQEITGFSLDTNEFAMVSLKEGTVTKVGPPETPTEANYILHQNFPNPFHSITNLKYSVKKPSNIQISIYDIFGREIKEIINQNQDPGDYTAFFNGSDLPRGIYFIKLRAGNFEQCRKMLLR